MSLKFTDLVRSEIQSLLADNTTGNISAADVRQVCTDIIDSAAPPDCAVLSTVSAAGQVISATPVIVPIPGAVASNPDASVISANATTREVTPSAALAGFLLTAIFECTINNVTNGGVVEFAFYVNGVKQRWTFEVVGRGNNAPLSVNIVARIVGQNPGVIDVRYSSVTVTSCTVETASLIVQVVPTRSAITP